MVLALVQSGSAAKSGLSSKVRFVCSSRCKVIREVASGISFCPRMTVAIAPSQYQL